MQPAAMPTMNQHQRRSLTELPPNHLVLTHGHDVTRRALFEGGDPV
jgi:hypothetical protein